MGAISVTERGSSELLPNIRMLRLAKVCLRSVLLTALNASDNNPSLLLQVPRESLFAYAIKTEGLSMATPGSCSCE